MTPRPPIFELAQGRAQARMKSRSGVTKMTKPKMTRTNTGVRMGKSTATPLDEFFHLLLGQESQNTQ